MKKGDYINKLFDEIKDKIEFDIDVISIKKLLDVLYEIDIDDSIKKWLYILNKYDIQKLAKDTDLYYILIEFPNKIIRSCGLKKFVGFLNNINSSSQIFLFQHIFNIFDEASSINIILKEYIFNNKESLERDFINFIVINQDIMPQNIFDLTYFLKKVILMHIESNKIDIEFFKKLSELPLETKNQSILKTLFLDYIQFA